MNPEYDTPDYYRREVNEDGSFATPEDTRNEDDVAKLVAQKCNCEVHRFGKYSPIDFYTVKQGKLAWVAELKSRTHPSTKYETVFLNFRKWLALSLAATGLGCSAYFIVKFSDGLVCWIALSSLKNPLPVRVDGGCTQRVKSNSDVEPVILVPIADMKKFTP